MAAGRSVPEGSESARRVVESSDLETVCDSSFSRD